MRSTMDTYFLYDGELHRILYCKTNILGANSDTKRKFFNRGSASCETRICMFVFVFDRSSPDSGYTLIHDLASRLQEARPDKKLAARAIYILYLGRYAFHQDCK